MLAPHIKAFSSSDAIYFDEVVGEIESSKDGTELLRPLSIHFMEGFLNFNSFSMTGSMHMSIRRHEEMSEKKLFFNYFMLEPACEQKCKLTLEVFGC